MNTRTQPETTPATRPGEPRLADYGGQCRPAEGVSTRDINDTDMRARLDDFNRECEAIRYGVVGGREW